MNGLTAIVRKNKTESLSIFTIWLFQLSAIIGISLGHQNWFISKTPLNLIILAVLLVINFPLDNQKKIMVAFTFSVSALLIEWIGVHYGFLFGVYSYRENLGIKIEGVPLLIGINWAILIFSSAAIADKLIKQRFLKVIFGALLMIFLDFFIEVSAPVFDFWTWELGTAPLRNYVAWFIISAALHSIFHQLKIKGNFTFSCHLYAAQLIFFGYFFVFYSR